MKRVVYTTIVVALATVVFLVACKNNDDPVLPLQISNFSPESGPEGTTVTITGNTFDKDNIVKFNDVPTTIVNSSATQLTVTVPTGAQTGKITVSRKGLVATSATDFIVKQPPTLTSFSPATGEVGSTITIMGTNFSAVLADNIVTFNGIPAAVTVATATQLIVTVPPGVSTGQITITIAGLSITSTTNFVVKPPLFITSFTPAFGKTGITVIITGTNFGNAIDDNIVKFNGTTAVVSAASSTQLTVTVPASATTGKVSVTANGSTTISTSDFQVGCPDVIILNMSISNIVSNNFRVTYDIKNIGTVPMTLTTMFIQAYISTNGTTLNIAAGGFADYGASETLLQPNEVRQKTEFINASASISSYPYVIFHLKSSAVVVPDECNTANNIAFKLIQ